MAQTTRTKKTRLACDACRRQRRKCDRRAPACSLCVKRNDVCVYDPTVDQRSPEQRDCAAALEARVALLEGVLRDAGTRDVAVPSGVATTDEGYIAPAMHAIAPPPVASTQLGPSMEPKLAPESELGFIPFDDAAQALAPITHPSPGGISATTPDELDLGMGGYVPLVSLDMEHKLLARFWEWQHIHIPFVAPAPLLAAYALYAQTVHHGEHIPPSPPSPPPTNPLTGPSATNVPSPESVHVTPELAQFISPLLLDAMFVIGALFHGNAKLSNQFYKRAEARVIGESANPRLATLQGVMLMAVAGLGHARASASWTLNGIVVALCVRLGMHVDATPLVRGGSMSKMLFEARNFVFWTAYIGDRYLAVCLGIHPFMDRRLISTPRHSSLAAANVVKPDAPVAELSGAPAETLTASGVGTTWWNPAPLGLGDVAIQAGWEAIRDLAQIMDTLFDEIYAFDAPKRSPQNDLELVARNNLTIQRFFDDLPAWLRSTDNIRAKNNGIVYLHLYIQLVSILACRPFLSPRPLSEDAMRIDATIDTSQPTHSSHIIRRYRTLAFRIARASALQITSLIRHIPLSSPCVTLPYFIYTASTILLLVPGDTAAMNGARTGVACLESLYDTGYWSSSMKDGRERVLALARRWGVDIGRGKRVLGSVVKGRGGEGSGTGGPSTGENNAGESDEAGSSGTGSGAQKYPGSSSWTRSTLESERGIGGCATRPSASTVMYGEEAKSGSIYSCGDSGWAQQDTDDPLAQMHVGQGYAQGVAPVPNGVYAAPLLQEDDITLALDTCCATIAQEYGAWEPTRNSYPDASGLMYAEPADRPSYAHQQQSYAFSQPVLPKVQSYGTYNNYSSHMRPGSMGHEHQAQRANGSVSAQQQQTYHHQPQYQQQPSQPLSEPQQQTQRQPHIQHQSRRSKVLPAAQHRIRIQQPYPQHYSESTPSEPAPYVTYALSHVEPQRDSCLPQTHWHQAIQPTDPNLTFPPDSAACADLPVCFADTVQTTQDPAFMRPMEDPYADKAENWVSDAERSFPAVTLDMYAGLARAGSNTGLGPMRIGAVISMSSSEGAPGIYAQDNEPGLIYGHEHPAYDEVPFVMRFSR
ncbi:hypothetical protein BDV93DRAFT_561265 [Ceratobasidium sp. AG-I]|nr:hypothetical protein BDV93DRAFT_561265 [Ceratobasidium sp. AG-I]